MVGPAALGVLAAAGALAGGSGIGRGTAVALGLGVLAVTALAAWRSSPRRLQPLSAPLRPAGRAPARRGRRCARSTTRCTPIAAIRRTLAWVFVLGVLAQGLRVVSIGFLAEGMGLDISFATLLVLCPVLFLVTIVPVSLNGIGLREATFVVVLGGAGVSREDAFALGLAYFAVGLSGALGGCAAPRYELQRMSAVPDGVKRTPGT